MSHHRILNVVAGLAVVAAILAVGIAIEAAHREAIATWAADRGYQVVRVEWVFYDASCPFWRGRGDDLRRAILAKDGREKVAFFRWRGWWMEQVWAIGDE